MYEEVLEKLKEDFDRLFPTEKSKARWVEWQTWPFNDEKPKIHWSCGICEFNDLIFHIKQATWHIGQRLYWRDISIEEM